MGPVPLRGWLKERRGPYTRGRNWPLPTCQQVLEKVATRVAILCGRQGLGKAASRAGSLTPIATSFPVYLVTDGAESFTATDSPVHLSPSGLL